jgi:lipopolysaccharide transport system ATP-binding protein
MSDIAIKVEDLGKLYRLGEVGTGTISHDLNRWVAKLRGKEDPFSKIGEINDRTAKGDSDYVWALKDVNFEVKKGEVMGIIGRNGAGKSTLLKLLSKVTQPSTGRIKVNGRIASLLEVGTGFHPEMTGRENIFLNGAIMGMTKREIKAKFDEIVDFAGVERYIDTPVKRYSSGMYVRLAFAVAAHLEPEILIVDEVLAVGDAEFQKKCLGKMKDVSVNDGRTVLFVSHNLPAINQLCNRVLYLKKGRFHAIGDTYEMLSKYKKDVVLQDVTSLLGFENEYAKILDFKAYTNDGRGNFNLDDEIFISITFECKKNNKSLALSFNVYNDEDLLMFEAFVPFANESDSQKRTYNIVLKIPAFTLNSGDYYISMIMGEDQRDLVLKLDRFFRLQVEENFIGTGKMLKRAPGLIRPKIVYDVQ